MVFDDIDKTKNKVFFMVFCASALSEIHEINNQEQLQNYYCRNAVFKLIVQCFVMPDFHSEPSSDASSGQGQQN